MKNTFFLLIGLAFIGGCVYLFLQKPVPAKYQGLMTIELRGSNFQVEVADTDKERIQGLSGRETLEEGTGMFFVFNEPARHGIWMKDMNFSIDIAWIDDQMKIAWLENSVSPDTFPQVFYPSRDVLGVIELPAGTFERLGVDIGDSVFPM